MSRANCKHPTDCVAGARGPCRKCSDMSASAERMRKLHADPEFAKANAERAAERMRKLHADPEFAKANAERMRKLHAEKRGFEVPEHLTELYALARSKGMSPEEALSFAQRNHSETAA